MTARKPKLGISKDRFTVGVQATIDFCGISFDSNRHELTVDLSASNHNWQIIRQHPHSNTGVRVEAIPTAKAGYSRDGDDDLTVTITVDETTDPVETEVTYDDIIYEGHFKVPKAKPATTPKKKRGPAKK